MWECKNCGCRAIAASLEFCPMCRLPRQASADSPPVEETSAGEAAVTDASDSPGGEDLPSQASLPGQEVWS
jgi:hypothetical protein